MQLRVIKWFFYLGTQLVAVGAGIRMYRFAAVHFPAMSSIPHVAAIGLIVCGVAGIVICTLGFANLAGEWKGKRDAIPPAA